MSTALDARVNALFDFAAAAPDGFTIDDACHHLRCTRAQVRDAIRQLRLALADDTINLICEPASYLEQWTYRLVGNYDDAKGWAANRISDCRTRMVTIKGVAASVVLGTDGRTIEGKQAKKIARTLGFLIEELADIDGAA